MTIDLKNCKPSRCTGTYREEYMTDDEWTLEEKYDGARYIACFLEGGKVALHSRYRFPAIEKASLVPSIFPAMPSLEGTVLDGEMLSPTTPPLSGVTSWMGSKNPEGPCPLWYVAFDCIYYKGEDIRHLPLSERRKYAQSAADEINATNDARVGSLTNKVRVADCAVMDGKAAFLAAILEKGGEGGVLKHLGSRYGLNWVKIKKRFDFSTVVTGYKPGKGKYADTLGAISVSVYQNGALVEVGHCSGMTDAVRTDIWNNQSLFLGRVLDVYAQEITDAGRMRHPVFHRFRADIAPADVTWEKLHEDAKAANAQAKAKGLTSVE